MITHLIPRLPVANNGAVIGGSASSVASLVRAQAASSYRPALVTGRTRDDSGDLYCAVDGADVHILEMRASPVSQAYGVEFSMKALLRGPRLRSTSILHGHSGRWHYMGSTRTLAARLNVPWVHTLYCPISSEGRVSKAIPALASSASVVVGMSENVARSAVATGIAPEKVRHIDPCIDFGRFSRRGRRSETRDKLRIPLDAEVILFVGNNRPEKGFDVLWNAFRTLAPQREKLMLAATFEDKGADANFRFGNSTGLQDRSRFLGVVSDMSDLMEAADLAVFPFRNTDGPSDYPTAMLEAMAIGTPVIATAIGGIPEVVTPDESGLLVPRNDVPALVAAIRRVLDTPALSARMSANARELAHSRFRPEVVRAQWDELYESIAPQLGAFSRAA